jgi:hypothetical protein
MGRERPLFLPFLRPLGFCVSGRKGWHYSPECVEGEFSEVELRLYGVLRSSGIKVP